MNCKACNQPLKPEMKFCVHCGAPVAREDAEPAGALEPSPQKEEGPLPGSTETPAPAETKPLPPTPTERPPRPSPTPPPRRPTQVWAGLQALFTSLGCLGLVVVLIAGVVRARPVYRRAHAKEEMAQCLGRLGQLGRAVRMYAQDYDGRLPRAENWADALQPYQKNRQNFFCPTGGAAFPYAFNQALSGQLLKQVKSPRGTILFFESEAGQWNASDSGSSLPSQGRHNGCNVICLADGTALWQPARDKSNFDPTRSFTVPHLPLLEPSPAPGSMQRQMMGKVGMLPSMP